MKAVPIAMLAAWAIGCASESPPAVDSGVGDPGIVGGPVQTGTGGIGGAAGAGGQGGAGGAPTLGLCANVDDFDALATTPNIGATNTFCSGVICLNAIGNPPFYRTCVGDCVARSVPGLSIGCADCYGDVSTCGLNAFCLNQCQFNACSRLCLNCLESAGCLERFEFCSGFPVSPCDDVEASPAP